MTALASILIMSTLKRANKAKIIIIGIFSCVIIYYLKDLSIALGQTSRISLTLSYWMPIIIIGIISFVGILQINENKFLSILAITTYLILSINNSYGKNISITAKDITIDKKEQITIFREDVVIIDVNKNKIKSDFASYNKNLDLYELKNNVSIEDLKGNTLISNKAIYDKKWFL